ncbi:MAG: hypothetical protein B6I38_03050 [Anaerolineaceae bacterium 4572_5.1]|nr:MAG: hypothetical protein B6I38_03050 [Anaerolineaceae bacterium 4572_5.1]
MSEKHSFLKRLSSLWFRLWEHVTEPHPSIVDENVRCRARTLAGLLVVLLPLYILPEVIRTFRGRYETGSFLSLIGSGLIFASGYILSRSRHHVIGAWLTLIYFSFAPVLGILVRPGRYFGDEFANALVWSMPILVMGVILLSPKRVKWFVFANFGLYLILPIILPGVTFSQMLVPFGRILAVGILLIVAAHFQQRYLAQISEQGRQVESSEINYRNFFNEAPIALVEIDLSVFKERLDNLPRGNSVLARQIIEHPDVPRHMLSQAALVDANLASVELFEAGDKEALQKNFSKVVTPEFLDTLRNGLLGLWNGERRYHEETTCKTLQGKQKDISERFAVASGYEESWKRVLVSITDITARKEAELTSRKLVHAVESSASSVVITNLDGVIEYVNPAFSRMTGYTTDEAIGQKTNLLKSGQHDDEFYEGLWRTIEQGNVWQGEIVNRRKDESLYWESQLISPVRDEAGEVTHYVAIKDDVSQRKEMEHALALAHEEALVASDLKTQLLANVSHDMRTPLGAILGYTEMLQSGVFDPLTKEQMEATRAVSASTQRLLDFVNNLLSQSQIEIGKVVLKLTPFEPARLLETMGGEISLARTKGLIVETEIDPELPARIYGDYYWLGQVLHNLFSNATKFTSPPGKIHVALMQHDEDNWIMRVSDTGKGIPKNAQEYIFESFRQVDGAPNRAELTGSGLGLSIVKHLVTLMKGEIQVESEAGKGSVFTVILPLTLDKEK